MAKFEGDLTLNLKSFNFQELLRIALEEEEKFGDGFILDTIERGGKLLHRLTTDQMALLDGKWQRRCHAI